MDIKEIIMKMNCASVDVVKARDELILFEKKVEIREAYLTRMRVALGEIEDLVEKTTTKLEGVYEDKTWIPAHEKVSSVIANPIPIYYDGLSEIVEKLRPILLGYK